MQYTDSPNGSQGQQYVYNFKGSINTLKEVKMYLIHLNFFLIEQANPLENQP